MRVVVLILKLITEPLSAACITLHSELQNKWNHNSYSNTLFIVIPRKQSVIRIITQKSEIIFRIIA
jgi:hypothetical protein